MPNQVEITVFERRDNTDRVAFGNAALASCRATRAIEGITAAKFYWYPADSIVFMAEGERDVLDKLADNDDYVRTVLEVSDMGRRVQIMRLIDPRAGLDNYQRAGRV